MRVVVIVFAALMTLGLAAFGIIAAKQAAKPVAQASLATAAQAASSRPARSPVNEIAQAPIIKVSETTGATSARTTPAPTRVAETTPPSNVPAAGVPAAAINPIPPAAAANGIPACDKPGGMGLSRIVEIDTTGGPAFGFEHFKQYDFLRENEVVLTFDDGPWPGNTQAVLKALADNCLKATFFEIGEHATWHPEITKEVVEAGNTVGSHTWSHKDLARNPYVKDIEAAKAEIEMGVSAVHMAAGAPIAPFFRFPDLQQPPTLLSYLGERNISTFSTDIDSFDFKIRKPEKMIESVMSKLKKRGKGIVLMHDFQHVTAEALPELLRQLKAAGFKIVHMVPHQPVTTLAKYDEMVSQHDKLSVTNTRPETSVVRTIEGN